MPKTNGSPRRLIFRTSFIHWRSGKAIKAKDYGHKAFPIFVRRKRR